jgi:type I restriction enzyme M protein
MTTDSIISKVWSFCHTLRDDGVGYGDYLEQLQPGEPPQAR